MIAFKLQTLDLKRCKPLTINPTYYYKLHYSIIKANLTVTVLEISLDTEYSFNQRQAFG